MDIVSTVYAVHFTYKLHHLSLVPEQYKPEKKVWHVNSVPLDSITTVNDKKYRILVGLCYSHLLNGQATFTVHSSQWNIRNLWNKVKTLSLLCKIILILRKWMNHWWKNQNGTIQMEMWLSLEMNAMTVLCTKSSWKNIWFERTIEQLRIYRMKWSNTFSTIFIRMIWLIWVIRVPFTSI